MDKHTFFICVYRPPQCNINHFYNALTEILVIVKDKNYSNVFLFCRPKSLSYKAW